MKIKVFTLEFSENEKSFDDSSMQEFIANKEMIDYCEHFFVHEKTPYITIILSYRDSVIIRKKGGSGGVKPIDEFDVREKECYEALRVWRAARAVKESVPPYLIANNKQLVLIIKSKIESVTGLSAIKG